MVPSIVGIDGAGDGLTADAPSEAALAYIVTVTYQPTQAGDLRRALRIRSDLGKVTITVTVTNTGTP